MQRVSSGILLCWLQVFSLLSAGCLCKWANTHSLYERMAGKPGTAPGMPLRRSNWQAMKCSARPAISARAEKLWWFCWHVWIGGIKFEIQNPRAALAAWLATAGTCYLMWYLLEAGGGTVYARPSTQAGAEDLLQFCMWLPAFTSNWVDCRHSERGQTLFKCFQLLLLLLLSVACDCDADSRCWFQILILILIPDSYSVILLVCHHVPYIFA